MSTDKSSNYSTIAKDKRSHHDNAKTTSSISDRILLNFSTLYYLCIDATWLILRYYILK
ncbi:hypothetical protein [Nostoc sp. UHCC 0251]|uniref:hypothetical protein n=1 Tax=Nostoc sp. UHCC 0251 TaxID=3110240 RepID=UPI002B1FB385|nr:hypothetical protein [Nostoc sp. UHCC 0251]MEA5627304.1 hypothetical protein [Nostoc sp. UHCC 0251]